MPIDDRLAKLLLEDNIITRLKQAEGDIDLLQKLATIKSVDLQTLPVPGEVPNPTIDNAAKLNNVFLSDEFTGMASQGNWFWGLNWDYGTDTTIESMDALFFAGYVANLFPYCPGIIRITSSITDAYFILQSPFLVANLFDNIQFVVFCEQTLTAGEGYIFGLTPDPSASTFEVDGSSEGIYFKYEFGDGNWQAITRDSGGVTQTDTGIAFDAAFPQLLFEIKRSTTDVFQFYINKTLVATHTTNITAVPLQAIFGAKMNAPGSWYIYIDYFSLQIAPFVQRWT